MAPTDIKSCCPANQAEWREWLEQYHETETSVWLVYYKVGSGMPTITHTEAIDHALCFGWIDSKGLTVDEKRYKVCFTRRKTTSGWSRINKEKVERLIKEGLMTKAGQACIDIAKQNGSWTLLDEVETLSVPPDLQKGFDQYPEAGAYFDSLSRSVKRALLQWLVLAKRAETRQKRVDEVLEAARQHKKPKQFA